MDSRTFTPEQTVSRVDCYIDIWKSARDVEPYENLIQKVFREEIDAEAFDAVRWHSDKLEVLLFPKGRPG